MLNLRVPCTRCLLLPIMRWRHLYQSAFLDSDWSPLRRSSGISLCADTEMQWHQFLTGACHLVEKYATLTFGSFSTAQVFGGEDFGVTAADELPCFFRWYLIKSSSFFKNISSSRDAFVETSFSEEQALIRWGCDLSMLFETLSKGKFVCYLTELF